MKYLKSYESALLDNILDKISKYGMKSIKPNEKEYLDKYYSGDVSELEKEIVGRRDRVASLWEYDPREDSEGFDELGNEIGVDFDFSKYDDEMIEQGRYSIMYDELEDSDLDHFVQMFDIDDAIIEDGEYKGGYKSWERLSDETQEKFKKYIDEIY